MASSLIATHSTVLIGQSAGLSTTKAGDKVENTGITEEVEDDEPDDDPEDVVKVSDSGSSGDAYQPDDQEQSDEDEDELADELLLDEDIEMMPTAGQKSKASKGKAKVGRTMVEILREESRKRSGAEVDVGTRRKLTLGANDEYVSLPSTVHWTYYAMP